MFLLAVEEGAFLGCNGWVKEFGYPLGKPLGKAVVNEQEGTMSRKFASGTSVMWNLVANTGRISWSAAGPAGVAAALTTAAGAAGAVRTKEMDILCESGPKPAQPLPPTPSRLSEPNSSHEGAQQ